MGKFIKKQSGYALMVILVAIVVMGLITPVMLTAATYGMKNTITTNNNVTARYLADTAYQETLNKVNISKASGNMSSESDVSNFISTQIVSLSGTLNGGTYKTSYHPNFATNPQKINNFNGDPKITKITYYLRSTGEVGNQKAFVDYSLSFFQRKMGGTFILYDSLYKSTTYDKLPKSPDDLQSLASGKSSLNVSVDADIANKLNGLSSPNIVFKDNITPPPSFNGQLKGTINAARLANLNLSGTTLKVAGDLYVDGNIVLGDNASLIVEGNLYIGGTFSVTANNNNKAATLSVKKDVIAKGDISFSNVNVNIEGNLFGNSSLNINSVISEIKIGRSIYLKKNLNMGNNGGNKGKLTVTNDIVAENIRLSHPNSYLKTGGEVLVRDTFDAKNNASIILTGGLEVGSQLSLDNGVVFNFAEKLYITKSLTLGVTGKMLLIKNSGTGTGASYKIDIEDPQKL